MASAINPNRPQTLKQAKKAYRKAGPGPRFSDIELRRLARAAELQERADRIKSREKKKKANRKKREEKMEKEREARRKAGLPEIREAHVGPSQLKLAFPGADCGKGKKDDESSDTSGEELVRTNQQGEPQTHCRISRTPLQSRSPNLIVKPNSQRATFLTDQPSKISDLDCLDFFVSNTQIEQELSTPEMKSPTTRLTKPASASHDKPSDILALISTQDLESSIKGSPANSATVFETSVAPSVASTEDFGSDGVYTDEHLQNLTQGADLKSAFKPNDGPENETICDNKKRMECDEQVSFTEGDSLLNEYAPSSKDILSFAGSNDFDEFDISTQDLQDLVP